MRHDIDTKELAMYVRDTHATVRTTAARFAMGRSTVHTRLTKNLVQEDPKLAKQIKKIFGENQVTGRIKGGQRSRAHAANKKDPKFFHCSKNA